MKVLHLNDLAGVAGILCKYLRKAGHQADCISFMDDHEFGFSKFYGYRHFQNQDIMAYFLKGMIPQYDIIHVHFSYTLLPWLYQFNKPIVMHYHGTEIATQNIDAMTADFRCKAILVAGEQLLQYHPRAEYLPTIVDTEYFYPMPELRKCEPGTSRGNLMFDVSYIDTQKVLEKAGRDTNIVIIGREAHTIPYAKLPETLNNYEGFIDIRYHKQRGLLTDRSKTGLEALACGLKVLIHEGEWLTELPERHKPEVVVKNLVEKYERILQ